MSRLSLIDDWEPLPCAIALLCAAAIPMTIFVYLTDTLVSQAIMTTDWLPIPDIKNVRAEIAGEEVMQWPDFLALYVEVLLIIMLVIALVTFLVIMRKNRNNPPAEMSIRPGAVFFSRLPEHIGTDLLYLQMEDHYLRVVTKHGEALILVRFRDAMNELEPVGGLQVHRSWWVVTGEIDNYANKGRKPALIMTNGARVPVSGSYREAVDALWQGRN